MQAPDGVCVCVCVCTVQCKSLCSVCSHSVLNRLSVRGAVMLVAMTSLIGLQAEVHNVKGSGKVGVLSDNSLLQ